LYLSMSDRKSVAVRILDIVPLSVFLPISLVRAATVWIAF
jgi:hypothetical protein